MGAVGHALKLGPLLECPPQFVELYANDGHGHFQAVRTFPVLLWTRRTTASLPTIR